jgi:hypothetical protein
MALSESSRYKRYDPVVSTTTFLVTFPIFDDDEVAVLVDGVEVTAFSVTATFDTGTGRADDAAVVLVTAVSGVTVEIYGTRAARADGGYSGNAARLTEVVGNDFDRLAAVQQEMQRDIGRALLAPLSTIGGPGPSPAVPDRVVAYDSNSNFTVSASTRQQMDAAVEFFLNGGGPMGGADGSLYTPPYGSEAIPRSVENRLSERVSIRDFGAVGNGVTDDTTAIQAAINYASKSRNVTIYAPAGHYIFDTIYLFYHPVLNPGYDQTNNPQRHGKIMFIGDGSLEPGQMVTYNPGYGTVFESTGDGVVVSRASLGHGNPTNAVTVTITGITRANPAVVTSVAHGLSSGHGVTISGVSGMTQVNGGSYEVVRIDNDTFALRDTDSTGFSAYVSGGTAVRASAGFPARKFNAINITFVGNKANAYALEAACCPFIKLDDVSIYQRNTAGHGARIATAWFVNLHNCRVFGVPGATGRGITSGTSIFAGLYVMKDVLVQQFRDGWTWEMGPFVNVAFYDCAFQFCSRDGIRGEGGRVGQLSVYNGYYESGAGQVREHDIHGIGTTFPNIVITSMYSLAGDGAMNSIITGPIIDVDFVESISINGIEAQRLSVPIMRVGAVSNGGSSSGNVNGVFVRNDIPDGLGGFLGPTEGDFFLFEGVRPDFGPNITFPGYQLGLYDATGPIRLFDPDLGLPHSFRDRVSGATILSPLGIGQTTSITPVERVDPTATGQDTCYVITATPDPIAVFMPESPTIPEGRLLYILNNAASASFINVWRNDEDDPLVLLARLRPGQGALFMWNGQIGRWALINLGISQQANITSLTDSSGGTASGVVPVIGATYSQTEIRNALASITAVLNSVLTNNRNGGFYR